MIRFGRNSILKKSTDYVTPNLACIEEKETLRDLGVIMSNDASFSSHVEQKSRWILRTFQSRQS